MTVTQGRDDAYWIGTTKGVCCYRPHRRPQPRPRLTVKTDQERTSAEDSPITSGQLVGFRTMPWISERSPAAVVPMRRGAGEGRDRTSKTGRGLA